jgi:hypothetical protein
MHKRSTIQVVYSCRFCQKINSFRVCKLPFKAITKKIIIEEGLGAILMKFPAF